MRPSPRRRQRSRTSRRRTDPRGPTAARSADGKIDAFRQGKPVDALEHEGEAEAELQLDDHRRLVAPDRDDVAAADLGLDVVALTFEEG